MGKEEKRKVLRSLWRTVRVLLVIAKAVITGQAISAEVEVRGSILLNHGIEMFGGRLAGNVMTTEASEDEDGPFAFLVAQMDGVEILQIDEDWTPPEEV